MPRSSSRRSRPPDCRSSCSPTTRSSPRATSAPACSAAGSTSPRTRSGPRPWPPPSSSTDQRPHGTAYVVGEAGLTTALHDVGYVMTDRDPDYVVLGETRTYSFEAITRAIRLIEGGARFIATNPDVSGTSVQGTLPGHRLGRRADQHRHRAAAVLHRQAEPADDAQRAEPARRPLRDDHDDRRPDGHRHHQRAGGGPAHGAGHDRLHAARPGRDLPLPAHPRRRLDRGPGRARRGARVSPVSRGNPNLSGEIPADKPGFPGQPGNPHRVGPGQGTCGSGQVRPVELSTSAARSTRMVRGRVSAIVVTTVVNEVPWARVAIETCGTHRPGR